MKCDTKEVPKLLKHLNANKSCGIDKIPAHLLKETADTSAVPLSMLFNLSFKQGCLMNYGNHPILHVHLIIRMVIKSQWKIIEAFHS